VSDVAECRLGKMLDKAKNRGTPRPYLRNTNVHWFRLELDNIKEMRFEDSECEEYALQRGDLLVCEGGHGIGRTAVWNGEVEGMMFQKALHRLRPRAGMNAMFLAYQLRVAADSGVMARYFTGTGIPHLTGKRLAEMGVNVPPPQEQERIVAKVEHLMKLCDELEAKLRRAEETAAKLVEAIVTEMVA
jgi:type I restriction enzyme S subunit